MAQPKAFEVNGHQVTEAQWSAFLKTRLRGAYHIRTETPCDAGRLLAAANPGGFTLFLENGDPKCVWQLCAADVDGQPVKPSELCVRLDF